MLLLHLPWVSLTGPSKLLRSGKKLVPESLPLQMITLLHTAAAKIDGMQSISTAWLNVIIQHGMRIR